MDDFEAAVRRIKLQHQKRWRENNVIHDDSNWYDEDVKVIDNLDDLGVDGPDLDRLGRVTNRQSKPKQGRSLVDVFME